MPERPRYPVPPHASHPRPIRRSPSGKEPVSRNTSSRSARETSRGAAHPSQIVRTSRCARTPISDDASR